MKYRQLSKEITPFEIQTLLGFIYEDAEMTRYERYEKENFIRVFFQYSFFPRKEEVYLDLLPDDVYLKDEFLIPEKERSIYQYRQYMIAKGYSNYWKGNLYMETECCRCYKDNLVKLIEDNQTAKILNILYSCNNLADAIKNLEIPFKKGILP